jgi:hypothetical protein
VRSNRAIPSTFATVHESHCVQVSRTPLPAPLPRTRTDGVGEAPRHEVAGLGRAIKYGRGTDLLIHQVCIAPAALMSNIMLQHVISLHTSPRVGWPGLLFGQAEIGRLYASPLYRHRQASAGNH